MNLGSSHSFAWLGLTSLFAFTTPWAEWRVIKSIRGISSKTFLLFLRTLLQHLWSSGLDHHRLEPGAQNSLWISNYRSEPYQIPKSQPLAKKRSHCRTAYTHADGADTKMIMLGLIPFPFLTQSNTLAPIFDFSSVIFRYEAARL